MTKQEYFEFARSLAEQAGVVDGAHEYWRIHRDRFYTCYVDFGLEDLRVDELLEIGPFYSYLPFVYKRDVAERVSVIEGDDPEAYRLKPLYEDNGIDIRFIDLLDIFGDLRDASNTLPYPDNKFHAITCWETMEHFNFNPVLFVREIYRILAPGGRVYVTVPNMAKLDVRLRLLMGRSIQTPIQDYEARAGSRYYGFHWREYVLSELGSLFAAQSFEIIRLQHVHTFQNRDDKSMLRDCKRALIVPLTRLFPSVGTLCTLVAQKP
tara:strand:- start:158 stop:952 length:795 start_codon:yes stop_codon:yes gene_type:complete